MDSGTGKPAASSKVGRDVDDADEFRNLLRPCESRTIDNQ